jgi:hypothetical protein
MNEFWFEAVPYVIGIGILVGVSCIAFLFYSEKNKPLRAVPSRPSHVPELSVSFGAPNSGGAKVVFGYNHAMEREYGSMVVSVVGH